MAGMYSTTLTHSRTHSFKHSFTPRMNRVDITVHHELGYPTVYIPSPVQSGPVRSVYTPPVIIDTRRSARTHTMLKPRLPQSPPSTHPPFRRLFIHIHIHIRIHIYPSSSSSSTMFTIFIILTTNTTTTSHMCTLI